MREGEKEKKSQSGATRRGVEEMATEAPRQREGWTARARNERGAIYGRLVVMVISREGEEGMKLSG